MYHINLTRMLAGAKDTLLAEKKPRTVPLELLIFLLVITIAQSAQIAIISVIDTALMMGDSGFYELAMSSGLDYEALLNYMTEFLSALPPWYYAVTFISAGAMIPTAILYCRWFEKRKPYTLGFSKRGVITEYIIGLLFGSAMICLPVLACYLTKCVSFSFSSADPATVALFFAAFILQGMGEEAIFRGYLLISLARRTKIWVAIIVSSLMFTAFHIGNSGFSVVAFINIFLFGVFASVFMLKRGSIWAVSAIHTAWNFIQGNVFGFSVSGNPKLPTIIENTTANHGWVLHGGEFGLEGGLGTTVVLLIAILIALQIPTKKSEYVEIKEDPEI